MGPPRIWFRVAHRIDVVPGCKRKRGGPLKPKFLRDVCSNNAPSELLGSVLSGPEHTLKKRLSFSEVSRFRRSHQLNHIPPSFFTKGGVIQGTKFGKVLDNLRIVVYIEGHSLIDHASNTNWRVMKSPAGNVHIWCGRS